jgi:hypothetical protein
LDRASTANTRIVTDSRGESANERDDRNWRRYLCFLQQLDLDQHEVDLLLEEEREIVGKAFFETVRNGRFDARGRLVGERSKPVAGATVGGAAGSVASTLWSHFRRSPFHEEGGSLTRGLDKLIRAYKNLDPPTKAQRAITPKILRTIYRHFVDDDGRNTNDTMNAHLVDINVGMFFFAGRCCEYAETPEGGKTK